MKSKFSVAGIVSSGCLFLACILNTSTASGQWYSQNVTGYDLYAVQYLNNNTIFCAGAALVKTQNGGASWSVLDLKDQNGADILAPVILRHSISSTQISRRWVPVKQETAVHFTTPGAREIREFHCL